MLISRTKGRRAVAGKLRWIKANMKGAQDPVIWEAYLRLLAEIYKVNTAWLTPPQIEAALQALGATPLDGMLPWYFRELLRSAKSQVGEDRPLADTLAYARGGLVERADIRDWYLGAQPNIMQFDRMAAHTAAQQWHHEQIKKVSKKDLPAWVFEPHSELGTLLESVRRWPDGHWLVYLDVPDASASNLHAAGYHRAISALMEIGKRLGHCYQERGTATFYVDTFDIWILFDSTNKPRWAMVTTTGTNRGDLMSIHAVHEVRGPRNQPVGKKDFKYLKATIGWLAMNDPSAMSKEYWTAARNSEQ